MELFEENKAKQMKHQIISSKHVEFAIVNEYTEPEQKISIMPTKKIHFDWVKSIVVVFDKKYISLF